MSRSDMPVEVLIVAVPETAGSALYGMVDVLSAAGNLWQRLRHEPVRQAGFRVRIVASERKPFLCGNDIPVQPHCSIRDKPDGSIVILPELWLGPDESFHGRYPELMRWVRDCYEGGKSIYSACSGTIMLAETGLLAGCAATSHWGYQDLFRRDYPEVRFRPEPNLVLADPSGRMVSAGGTTSWHDLALHIIARHLGPVEAIRIAKVYLLKWHDEGQGPYTPLVLKSDHTDARIRQCEDWLSRHFAEHSAIRLLIEESGLAERTLKRRFKQATGVSLVHYLQNVRVERAKHLLETTTMSIEEISFAVGYEDVSFCRELFRRLTGTTPGRYRRLFFAGADLSIGKARPDKAAS
ncbi:transcriptional regulator, AraC family [Thioalkalivibrio sp. K90mix]|uniref:GlxA family transcriptional regulator n=1 Tax=Thioalkalivibrio sp. (strain K90mix) TaxID=396595 RepID=UPI000195A610|nr:helix-turn-helix domain-containing protein [Thioalkalivibrio sp. K90mix]ADC72138.1 transcriptional regulator, AraC family [Thioalkalivibrio sp. K90mix]